MIDTIITTLAKLATGDLTRKQVILVITFLVLTALSIILYERYTSTFRLTRLETATHLLKELVELKPRVESDPDLKTTHDSLLSALNSIVGTVEVEQKHTPHSFTARLIGGLWMWIIFGIAMGNSNSTDKTARYAVWVLGTIISLICVPLPEGAWPWRHYLLYPIVSISMIFLALMILGITASSKEKKEAKKT